MVKLNSQLLHESMAARDMVEAHGFQTSREARRTMHPPPPPPKAKSRIPQSTQRQTGS